MRIVSKMIALLMILLCFCSCKSQMDDTQTDVSINSENYVDSAKEPMSTAHNIETVDNTADEMYVYYTYYSAGKSEEYQNLIRNNTIDTDYATELSECNSTQEQIDLENKYIDIWKTELDKSIELLMDKCDEQQKKKISSAQSEWEESLLLQMEMEKEILFDDIGRGMIVKWLSKYKDEYRYRTFEIMYLSYYIDLWDIPITNKDR